MMNELMERQNLLFLRLAKAEHISDPRGTFRSLNLFSFVLWVVFDGGWKFSFAFYIPLLTRHVCNDRDDFNDMRFSALVGQLLDLLRFAFPFRHSSDGSLVVVTWARYVARPFVEWHRLVLEERTNESVVLSILKYNNTYKTLHFLLLVSWWTLFN